MPTEEQVCFCYSLFAHRMIDALRNSIEETKLNDDRIIANLDTLLEGMLVLNKLMEAKLIEPKSVCF